MNVSREQKDGAKYDISGPEAEQILQTPLRGVIALAEKNSEGSYTLHLTNDWYGTLLQEALENFAKEKEFSITHN